MITAARTTRDARTSRVMAPPESAVLEAPAHPVNNFDLLRLFAALLVFWFHALVFTGRPAPLLFSWVTPGPLGVYVFFLISGYLVSKSWQSDPHAGRFLARGSLRIFPALVVLTTLILGPALTTLPLTEYLHGSASTVTSPISCCFRGTHCPASSSIRRFPMRSTARCGRCRSNSRCICCCCCWGSRVRRAG